ncbi:DNA-directed RNA polymerase subunit beta [Candidatus Gracilibacteria bacterium]|nr:DNA-directed RNA polymerase subunit beta [Candidatus Gracilibacteria bacterium]
MAKKKSPQKTSTVSKPAVAKKKVAPKAKPEKSVKAAPSKKVVVVEKKVSAPVKPAPVAVNSAKDKEPELPVIVKKVVNLKAIRPAPVKRGFIETYLPDTTKQVLVLNGAKRKFLNTEKEVCQLPNLIETQINSYQWFLTDGVRDLLDEISPIVDFSGKKLELHFLEHTLGEPKNEPEICKNKNLTYESPLKVHVQLINKESGEIKEQDVFLGSVPLMTDRGTFIINGIERVVVSQIVRSPGVFFSRNNLIPQFHNAKIIPKRGAWLEIETDKKGIITVKIDRKRKIPITSLLRVFGFDTDKEILDLFNDVNVNPELDSILLTLSKDPAKTVDEAYQQIYKKIRPGDLATPENAKSLIRSMFFDYKKYDMGAVARYKLNRRFKLDTPNVKENHTFQVSDLVGIIKYLVRLNNGEMTPDDIDHLSNRRIRGVGELVQNKFRVGLLRTERIVKDRMTVMDIETVTPTQLINSRPITAALREFYASSQLSQFMDQTNPLAELAHKRRLSAMGPGGLSRERASFDVRDVHPSHYGRICPIATPEGPNIGLVVHLAAYAKVNAYGFIETPFREVGHEVKNGSKDLIGRTLNEDILVDKKVIAKAGTVITESVAKELAKAKDKTNIPVRPYITSKVAYYDAEAERDLVIAQANSEVNEMGEFVQSRVASRKNGEPQLAHINDITNMDVSPKQIISETTALIPFLEHDDNTRASMGSNMQRQAVSLVSPEAPVVGTGMEEVSAKSSGQVIMAEETGTVSYVDAKEVSVIYESGRKKTYRIPNYTRSNQATCIHYRVRAIKGQKVRKGDVLADGSSVENGELALGSNILVAYMPWHGYNFEDAVIISERLVRVGKFDSVHIEHYTIDVRDTKLGPEIITRDIPNVGENRLKDLDEEGIIRIGAKVEEGDILVGKITPKGETELTAEERLLRAIFGDKARDVKDTSLRMPGGSSGKVVDVVIFTRKDGDELATGVNKQIRVSVAQMRKISVGDKVAGRHGNKGIISLIVAEEDMPYLPDGTPIDMILNPLGVASRMNIGQILETHLGWAARTMGFTVASPALNGVTTDQINEQLKAAGLPKDGKIQLFDGQTGEAFDRETTVGIAYIMKLSHLIEDKIHARSVGPYSLVTQQPLGGKAQHGGQRFGEMEVWALEAYGAAHTLQEMLTIKSDDVYGRAKAYEAIVKGESIRKPRTPASFDVLVKELQSLGLSVNLLKLKYDNGLGEDEYIAAEEAASQDSPFDKEIHNKIDHDMPVSLEGESLDGFETEEEIAADEEAEKAAQAEVDKEL